MSDWFARSMTVLFHCFADVFFTTRYGQIREIREELVLNIEVLGEFGVSDYQYPGGSGRRIVSIRLCSYSDNEPDVR